MAKGLKELIISARRRIHYKKRIESKVNELTIKIHEIQNTVSSLQNIITTQNQILETILNQYQQSLLNHLEDYKQNQDRLFNDLTQLNQNTHSRLNTLLIHTLRSNPQPNHKKHILFIVHNMTAWTALSGIYQTFKHRHDVVVFVLAIQAEEQNHSLQNAYSLHTQAYLQQENIAYHTLNPHDIEAYLAYMASINPDYVIRQSPWDADIPALCSALHLAKYKIIYIPYYSLDLLEAFEIDGLDLEINQNFHLYCHKIYCNSQLSYDKARKNFISNPNTIKFLGNTKLEYLTQRFNQPTNQPTNQPIHILWAPHHSINSEWLAFGTFEKNCLFFIDLAKELGNKIHIKYRPHPILSVSMNHRFPDIYHKFIEEINTLDNLSIDDDWNYINSFEWSDMLITDGISFIAEYPLTNKPIVFIENPNHMKFNQNGQLARQCCHIASNNTDIANYVYQALNGKLYIRTQEIEQYKQVLKINDVAKHIVADILQN